MFLKETKIKNLSVMITMIRPVSASFACLVSARDKHRRGQITSTHVLSLTTPSTFFHWKQELSLFKPIPKDLVNLPIRENEETPRRDRGKKSNKKAQIGTKTDWSADTNTGCARSLKRDWGRDWNLPRFEVKNTTCLWLVGFFFLSLSAGFWFYLASDFITDTSWSLTLSKGSRGGRIIFNRRWNFVVKWKKNSTKKLSDLVRCAGWYRVSSIILVYF